MLFLKFITIWILQNVRPFYLLMNLKTKRKWKLEYKFYVPQVRDDVGNIILVKI